MRRCCVVLLAWLPAAAHAQAGLYGHELGFYGSLLHFQVPALETTIEYRASPKIGVAGIGGIGYDGDIRWDAGAQLNGYVLGDFSTGLMLGLEGLVGDMGDRTFEAYHVDYRSDVLWTGIGAYGGAKGALEFGLTGIVQLGLAWRFEETYIDEGSLGLLLNLGVGWSF